MHIMSTNVAKTLFGNMNMTLNGDAKKSALQIQMTTVCHWVKTPPMKNFSVCHCQYHSRFQPQQQFYHGCLVVAYRDVIGLHFDDTDQPLTHHKENILLHHFRLF